MAEMPITVFYDGHCGLCHGLVRFLIARDPTGEKFDFAPLQGEYCAATISQAARRGLPDSVVVRTAAGELRVKSAAVLYILERTGGVWRAIGVALSVLPNAMLDIGYDFVARMRRRLFRAPPNTCPMVPRSLRERFHP